jgi:hypothetical protein
MRFVAPFNSSEEVLLTLGDSQKFKMPEMHFRPAFITNAWAFVKIDERTQMIQVRPQ